VSNPKIVYPTQPSIPDPPAVDWVAGGAFAQRTYYFRVTYGTPYGESLPSIEFSAVVPANNLPRVASPAEPAAPTVATGWNVYASTSAGTETRQNVAAIAIGTSWTMPASGLVAGSALPTTWGATLSFIVAPRFVPHSSKRAVRSDTYSTGGVRQTVMERIDQFMDFKMEWIAAGADAAAWEAFLASALQGIPFDYYPDAAAANYTTYAATNTDAKLAYKAPGRYEVDLEFRREVQLVTPPVSVPVAPTDAAKWIPFTAPNAGNFTLAHGLGYVPSGVCQPLMTSAGDVWFQAVVCDAVNLYLVASDVGLTGLVLVW
jgi:hypothetical protein